MTRYLVAGATGFIGQHIVARLLAEGHPVRALGRSLPAEDGTRTDSEGTSEKPGASGMIHIQSDLTDPATLRGVCDGIEVVINLAGTLGRWGVSRAELDAVNVQGALNLAAEARRSRVRHFVHVSSAGATGPGQDKLMNEATPCRPQTDYEASKHAAELALLQHVKQGLPLTVARPTFTYGPGDRHKLPLFRAIAHHRFVLVNSGRSRLHPVCVHDLVDGLLLAARSEPRARTYVLGGPRPLTTRELAETIAAALDVNLLPFSLPAAALAPAVAVAEILGRLLNFEPLLTHTRLAQWRDDYAYDTARARTELGYNPHTEFASGVAETVADYRQRGWL